MGRGASRSRTLSVRFLPTLVYDVERAYGGMVAVENPRIQRPYPGGIAVGMDLERVPKAQYLQCELKPVDHRVGVTRHPIRAVRARPCRVPRKARFAGE